jgi:hypothetical protein
LIGIATSMCGARAFIPSMPAPIAPINLFRETL